MLLLSILHSIFATEEYTYFLCNTRGVSIVVYTKYMQERAVFKPVPGRITFSLVKSVTSVPPLITGAGILQTIIMISGCFFGT